MLDSGYKPKSSLYQTFLVLVVKSLAYKSVVSENLAIGLACLYR
jgi:hypothetical protein